MRRLAPLAALTLAAGVLAGTAAGSGGVRLIEASGPGFPVRSYVLSLPNSRQLAAGDVHVTENGRPVADLSVVPASRAGRKTFGVVLVVDASDSMAGVAIRRAVAAERAFAARRNPNQELGVIAFSTKARVVLPLTSSAKQISAALASTPKLAVGTHIFDAVAEAETMLTSAKIGSGSIVVLSDGSDTGSSNTAAQVATAAREAHIRLFAIGLRSKAFKPASLETLAAGGGGDFTVAKSTRDLGGLFGQIGQLLSSEYLVQFKSLAGPSLQVKVNAEVGGVGAAASTYTTPALSVPQVPKAYSPSLGDRIWGSVLTMVILALISAAVVALLVIAFLLPRRSGLPVRISEFVSVPGLHQEHGSGPGGDRSPAVESEDAWPRAWDRFAEILEIAQIQIRPTLLVLWTVAATAATFLLVYLGTGLIWWSLLALLIPFGVREWVVRALARRRNRFSEQLPDSLQVISSALRAGHSFAGALAVVVESASEPMKSEMQRVVADEQRGIRLQDSLTVVAKRMNSRDLDQLALVAELQREAGGNAAEVVDRVAETVRARFDLKRLIQTLTVQGRMSRWIVTALPIAIVLILQLINPHYLHPLVRSTTGQVVLGFAIALCAAGSFAIKKIVDIKV